MKRRVLSTLLLTLGGLSLALPSVSGSSQEQPSHATCPPLPEQGPVERVSVYVTKTIDVPGVVCVRAINGFSSAIVAAGVFSLGLQKWERGKFQDFQESTPGSTPTIIAADRPQMSPGVSIDHQLPFSGQPAPPGRYRACFRYNLLSGGEWQEAYSEEFSLP
jgi:hypothetical protein